MAIRPVYRIKEDKPFFSVVPVEFVYYSGFSSTQKMRSVTSLHEAYKAEYPESSVLEISNFSQCNLGKEISAFNLKTEFDNNPTVECVFQAGKVFEDGGPYTDLLFTTSGSAKKDQRLTQSGKLVSFSLYGESFPIEPKTFFYDWIYINALNAKLKHTNELDNFDAFTDIVFNPSKSVNCQARSAAIYCALKMHGLLDEALYSRNDFLNIVYK